MATGFLDDVTTSNRTQRQSAKRARSYESEEYILKNCTNTGLFVATDRSLRKQNFCQSGLNVELPRDKYLKDNKEENREHEGTIYKMIPTVKKVQSLHKGYQVSKTQLWSKRDIA